MKRQNGLSNRFVLFVPICIAMCLPLAVFPIWAEETTPLPAKPKWSFNIKVDKKYKADTDVAQKAHAISGGVTTAVYADVKDRNVALCFTIKIQNVGASATPKCTVRYGIVAQEIPGDNHAERALLKPVIARKISFGSRSETGAHAFAVLASLLGTARRQNRSPLDFLSTLLTSSTESAQSALYANSS